MKNDCNVLIFSPHVDDEVLGCFSFLDADALVVFAGIESRANISRQQRIDELDESVSALGFHYQILENEVNRYNSMDLIEPFEAAIARVKPETVLLPLRSYNQDHRAVYDAALVATRPHDINWRANRVLAFEQPHSEIWPYENHAKPNWYRKINIDEKLTAYARYASQVRGHRSPATVSALAALRGAEIGEDHAEAFHVLRWIDY
jgi:LmbE family N-acetylglucosaminyl deacetylase